jgi:hypothetical protein
MAYSRALYIVVERIRIPRWRIRGCLLPKEVNPSALPVILPLLADSSQDSISTGEAFGQQIKEL